MPPAPRRTPKDPDTDRLIRLDGLAVRRRRHAQGWSPRDLVSAIAEASFIASGLRRTLTPSQIEAVEAWFKARPRVLSPVVSLLRLMLQ